ncbi:MAG: fimbiral protein pilA [Polyangiaceae bacterium]|nr:fimbiral protein pilA [Polyangiaceae bacterium]
MVVLIVVLVGGVFLVGTLGSLAIYGMRRYLAAAKTAEAKNTIGAVSRGARAAYEQERIGAAPGSEHALCRSATPVPALIPKGVKYLPGNDFDTGDADTGWKCLRFKVVQPIYYQYNYRQNGPFLTPGLSPDPNTFEVVAMGDLDGDADPSLFSISGRAASGTVTMSPTLFIQNEFE